MAEIVDAALDHLPHLVEHLRADDVAEIRASSGVEPEAGLRSSLLVSTVAWTLLSDQGDPVCIFGCAPGGPPGVGSVWMLGTSEMDTLKTTVARKTLPYLRRMHEPYPVLWNWIDGRNLRSLQWLRWAGFRVIDADPQYGVEKRLFLQFSRLEYV